MTDEENTGRGRRWSPAAPLHGYRSGGGGARAREITGEANEIRRAAVAAVAASYVTAHTTWQLERWRSLAVGAGNWPLCAAFTRVTNSRLSTESLARRTSPSPSLPSPPHPHDNQPDGFRDSQKVKMNSGSIFS
uniref:Uncharacterized protein n=1 Tax=Plectus sambesii TaxID=2011161 RepID=A0A914WCG1_9BILA